MNLPSKRLDKCSSLSSSKGVFEVIELLTDFVKLRHDSEIDKNI